VPDDFWAVRVGFANVTDKPWDVSLVKACASSAWGDYINPLDAQGRMRPASDWSDLTCALEGRDDDRLVTRAGSPRGITVRPNTVDPASGEPENTAWTWSDWVPCASVGTDPTIGMRILMIRALVPGNQTVVYCNGMFEGYYANPALNHGYDYYMGGLVSAMDRVTDPGTTADHRFTATNMRRTGFLNGSIIACVQAMTTNRTLVGMSVGDSHHCGTGTTTAFYNYLLQYTAATGRDHVGAIPFGMVNAAVGGMRSCQSFARMDALIDAVRPNYVVLPGWSYNDHNRDGLTSHTESDVFFARLLAAASRVRASGAIPIWLTPFPRDQSSMLPTILRSWLKLREDILGVGQQGEIVIDAASLLGATKSGVLDGTYISGLSNDAVHPNEVGHARIAAALRELIGTVLPNPASTGVT
jgi:hypothetical protein